MSQMRPYMNAGLAMTALLSLPLLPLPVVATQPSASTIVLAETLANPKLLEAAKQHYRQAEFKQAIALYQQVLTQAQQTGDRANQIEALLQLGEIDIWIGNVTQAEVKFQQALKLSRETNDRSREGFTLALLSAVYRNRQDYAKANELLKESLAIAQQTKDQKLEARSRFFIGTVFYVQKQYPQALDTLQQALKVAQADNNQDEAAHIYDYLAATYRDMKDFKQAEETSQQQQKLSRDIGYRLAEYDGLNTIASLQQEQKQTDQVLQTYQKRLAIAQTADNPWFQKEALLQIGLAYIDQKQLPQGFEYLQKALTVARSIGDDSIGWVQNRIGVAYYKAKKYPQALEVFQRAITLYQKTGNQTELAQVWLNVGESYYAQKQYSQAREAYQKALTLYQQPNNLPGQAKTFQNIGYAYLSESNTVMHENNYAQAFKLAEQGLAAFQQSLEAARKIPDRQLEALVILGISQVYDRQADVARAEGNDTKALALSEQALKPAEEALALNQQIQNQEGIKLSRSLIATVYLGLINSYNSTKQFDLALETVRKAEKLEGLTDEERHNILFQKFVVYGDLVNAYDNPRQYTKKLEVLQKGIELARQLKNSKTEVRYLLGLGQIYYFWGRYAEASDTYQQALSRAREIKERQYEVLTLLSIGLIYDAQANYPEALKVYEQALQLSRASNQSYANQLVSFNNMANVYGVQGQYAQALSTHQRVLATHQKFYEFFSKGVTPNTIRALCTTNENFRNTATLSKAGSLNEICDNPTQLPTGSRLNAFKEMMQLMVGLAQSGTATSYGNIAKLYSEQGNYPKALEFQQKAIEIFREQKDQSKEALTLNNMGIVYKGQGNYAKALEVVQQALNLAVAQNDPASETLYQLNLGSIYSNWGKYPEALAAYQRSLTLANQLKKPSSKALVLLRSATVYSNQGQFAKALTNLQAARDIWQKVGEPAHESEAIRLIADVYKQLGQYPQAIATYQQALAITQKINARPLELQTLSGLATTYREQGQTEQALKTFQQALNLARTLGDRNYESLSLAGIGKIYLKQSQPQQALEALQPALTIQQQIGTRPNAADTLSSMGQAHLQLGTSSGAQSNLQQAIALARETGDAPIEAQALNNLGQLFTKQKQPELAIVFYKQSVKLTEDIRKGIRTLPKDQQQSYTETVADTYRQLADLLLKRDRVLEAQQVLDLLKIQELDDYLRNVRGGGGQALYELPAEQAILAKYNALNQSAIALGQELTQLSQIPEANRTPAQQQQIQQLKQLQEDLNKQFNAFTDRSDVVALLKQLSPNILRQSLPLEGLDRLRDDLRRLNAVIIYPLVLDDRLELIITTPDSPPLRRTVNVKREDLNRAITQFRQALQNPTVDAKATAQQLYTWLIKPLENDLKQAKPTTLIYAPDAQLRYIPISALHDGNQWLAQRYSINNITAQSLTDFTAKPRSKPRILAGAFAQGKYTIGALSFQGLPFAGREVATLKTLLPNTKNLIDAAFSRTATTTQMNEYNILHLATHAAFVPGAASNSFILFGDGNIATLEDIRSWTLNNLDLVVLSACETGLGGKLGENGEEVLGLGYQFQSRGARATIASLWQVDDGGTQVLMDNFYTNLQAGETKAEALRQAQLTLITGKAQSSGSNRSATLVARWQGQLPSKVINQLNHPYYWAPFILIGNGL
jgi:CHAT domain-containing protein/tetratricopeptide (TPR) repeat protein